MKSVYQILISKIPPEVSHVTETLEKAGFEAYLVGGCVRDLIMSQILSGAEGGREPKDWDITTNAKPEEIVKLFEKTVYENTFGTVAVIQENVSHETLRQIEVTPYRIEAKYTDFRHPEEVKFSDKLEDDLKRRDFTINAMALSSSAIGGSASGGKGHLIDLFEGLKDIEKRTIRTEGGADERFSEDALRMIRAVRLAVELDFSVSHETMESILKNADLIKKISNERIRDEFEKIIMSPSPASGVVMLSKFGLLQHIIPELEEGMGVEQLGEHIYDVWNHLLHALQHAADKGWPLEIRLAALFHDIGKPRTRRGASLAQHKNLDKVSPDEPGISLAFSNGDVAKQDIPEKKSREMPGKKKYTFYGHEVVGARMAKKIMERLKFPKKETELVEKLVRNHMFFSDTELITLSAVRRIITKVGVENIWLLMNVRECDRV